MPLLHFEEASISLLRSSSKKNLDSHPYYQECLDCALDQLCSLAEDEQKFNLYPSMLQYSSHRSATEISHIDWLIGLDQWVGNCKGRYSVL